LKHHGISERLALMWLKQDPEQARLAIDAAEADRAGKIKTSTGAYIRKLIEDGATLGQSGLRRREGREKQATKDKALLDKLRSSTASLRARRPLPPSRPTACRPWRSNTSRADQRATGHRWAAMPAPEVLELGHQRQFPAPGFPAHRGQLDQAGFDAYLRDKGHDPEALRASAALLPPEEQAA
jgi:hypothetical protein